MIIKVENAGGGYYLIDGVKSLNYTHKDKTSYYCTNSGHVYKLKTVEYKNIAAIPNLCIENMEEPDIVFRSFIDFNMLPLDAEFIPLHGIAYTTKEIEEYNFILFANRTIYILNDLGKTIEVIR